MTTTDNCTHGAVVARSLDEGLVLHEGDADWHPWDDAVYGPRPVTQPLDRGSCAAGGDCTPEEPNGSDDGFSTCTGCNNDVWVGYSTAAEDTPRSEGAYGHVVANGTAVFCADSSLSTLARSASNEQGDI